MLNLGNLESMKDVKGTKEALVPERGQLVHSRDMVLASKSLSRGGVSDVDEMRERLSAAESVNKELLAAQARLERAEAHVEEESCQLKQEQERTSMTVEALQKRLSEVEAEHQRFLDDNAQLQRRLDDHQAELGRNNQKCLENEAQLREAHVQIQEAQMPPVNTIDPATYEERLAGHEQNLRNHSEQLIESERTLKGLHAKLLQAEADRDQEKRENEKLVQKQLELAQALQFKTGPGTEPIHQYPDFKTVRGFRFKVHGQTHKIEVAHSNGEWQLALDGDIVKTLGHKVFGAIFKKDQHRMECKVSASDGQQIVCILRMEWTSRARHWEYNLTVNNCPIPHCWERRAKDAGRYVMDPCWEPPEVLGAAPIPSALVPQDKPRVENSHGRD
jgi:hypothetical protein